MLFDDGGVIFVLVFFEKALHVCSFTGAGRSDEHQVEERLLLTMFRCDLLIFIFDILEVILRRLSYTHFY